MASDNHLPGEYAKQEHGSSSQEERASWHDPRHLLQEPLAGAAKSYKAKVDRLRFHLLQQRPDGSFAAAPPHILLVDPLWLILIMIIGLFSTLSGLALIVRLGEVVQLLEIALLVLFTCLCWLDWCSQHKLVLILPRQTLRKGAMIYPPAFLYWLTPEQLKRTGTRHVRLGILGFVYTWAYSLLLMALQGHGAIDPTDWGSIVLAHIIWLVGGIYSSLLIWWFVLFLWQRCRARRRGLRG